jgi:hypothetical protein
MVEIGHGEGGDEPTGLAGEAERFATGGEDLQIWAGAKQRPGQLGAGIYEVLAVVQDQQ